MLDLCLLEPTEPRTPESIVIFQNLGVLDFWFHKFWERFKLEVKFGTGIEINSHSMSPHYVEGGYKGDFYIAGLSFLGVHDMEHEQIVVQKAVQHWRYRSSEFGFHLHRWSYSDTNRWGHFVITDTPSMFGSNLVQR